MWEGLPLWRAATDQVAGLELTESFLLCGRAAMRTHIKNIVIFFHPMAGM